VLSPSYLRDAKRVAKRNPELAAALVELHRRLHEDAFALDLGTHKLKGKLKRLLACTVAYDLRLVFRIARCEGEESVELLKLGTHDEVY
jgi:mRNA interferase YafQ